MPVNLSLSRMDKSAELLATLRDYEWVLVVMHDNPDPDAIASGWGVAVLIEEKLGKPVRVIGGGAIVRAENRHMVELLQPPIELIQEIALSPETATILVDCSGEAANHLLTRQGITPVAIVDHHTNGVRTLRVPYEDIRPDVAASASIVASYLREQQVEPGPKLATAMLYAIRTETRGQETHHSALDREILPWLTERAEPSLVAEIENAPLPRDYFGDLLLALQSTFLYGDTALCFLPQAAGAEIVGEVADLLIRCEAIRRVLCAAIVHDDLLLSARTQHDGDSAVHLLLTTLDGLGGAGGHSHRAGGKIPQARKTDGLQDQLRGRWLNACGADQKQGSRLIAKSEIVKNLGS